MALLVELVGAPGAGKTSLLAALDGFRTRGGRVRPASDLARPPRRGLPRGLARRIAAPEDPRVLRRALEPYSEEWDALLRLIMADRSTDPRSPGLRLEALGWTRQALALTALVRSASDDVFVLDEGMLQRVTAVLGPSPTEADIDRYAALVPRADLVLHLVADDETLARRLDSRAGEGRVNARHVGLDRDARRAALRADADLLARLVAIAAASGQDVVPIDASDGADPAAAARAAVSDLRGTSVRRTAES